MKIDLEEYNKINKALVITIVITGVIIFGLGAFYPNETYFKIMFILVGLWNLGMAYAFHKIKLHNDQENVGKNNI